MKFSGFVGIPSGIFWHFEIDEYFTMVFLCICKKYFALFSRRFRRKCATLTVDSFFRQFNAISPLFCSFVQHHQLELRTSKTYSKRQNLVQNKNIDVQNLGNIGCPPLVFFTRIFFGTMRLFLKFFGFHQMVSSPLRLFRYFATQWISKNPKGSPCYIFRHCDTVQKSH